MSRDERRSQVRSESTPGALFGSRGGRRRISEDDVEKGLAEKKMVEKWKVGEWEAVM